MHCDNYFLKRDFLGVIWCNRLVSTDEQNSRVEYRVEYHSYFLQFETKKNANYSLNWLKEHDNYSLENQTLLFTGKHGVKRNNSEPVRIFFFRKINLKVIILLFYS